MALDWARPVLVQYADPFQALLFPGRALSSRLAAQEGRKSNDRQTNRADAIGV